MNVAKRCDEGLASVGCFHGKAGDPFQVELNDLLAGARPSEPQLFVAWLDLAVDFVIAANCAEPELVVGPWYAGVEDLGFALEQREEFVFGGKRLHCSEFWSPANASS